MTRRGLATSLMGALILAACGGHSQQTRSASAAHAATAVKAPVDGSPELGQSGSRTLVAVAYLSPDLVLSLDVATGRLSVSGLALGFANDRPLAGHPADQTVLPGVVGISDPVNHRLYRYEGGIPGLAVAPPEASAEAALPAAGWLPVWRAPREIPQAGHLIGLTLPDGRRIGITEDPLHRITSVAWPSPRGSRLRTAVSYAGALTTITDPFGVSRTYQHMSGGRVVELVPASWRTGPGYQHWIAPVIDNSRETLWIQRRTVSQRPQPRDLLAGLPTLAGIAYGGTSYDSPANGGYINIGLASLGQAAQVVAGLRELGLLDVSAILPTFNTASELRRLTDSLHPAFGSIERACHVTWGDGVDAIVITVADTITPAEVAVIDRTVARTGAWVVIQRGGSSVCAVFS